MGGGGGGDETKDWKQKFYVEKMRNGERRIKLWNLRDQLYVVMEVIFVVQYVMKCGELFVLSHDFDGRTFARCA
jgi:hypothetical protein